MSARDEVLTRIRSALGDGPRGVDVPRDYRLEGACTPDIVERFIDRLVDYKATVIRSTAADVGVRVAELLNASVVVPDGVPDHWLAELSSRVDVVRDAGQTAAALDKVATVLTSCALAVAETGTIVLDHGLGQGRRALSLVPDHHVVVVRVDQVVAGVVDAFERLDPCRPMTWISGPSATSDIELNRVEGVHGPRRLDVVLVD